MLPIAGALFVLLWLWTLFASDASWTVVTAFWLVTGGAITLWVRRDMRSDSGDLAQVDRDLESALEQNAADVYAISARAFAELEEIERLDLPQHLEVRIGNVERLEDSLGFVREGA